MLPLLFYRRFYQTFGDLLTFEYIYPCPTYNKFQKVILKRAQGNTLLQPVLKLDRGRILSFRTINNGKEKKTSANRNRYIRK